MANLFQRIVAQINPFDQGATFKNPTPQRKPQPQPQQQAPRVNLQQLNQAFAQQQGPKLTFPQPSQLPAALTGPSPLKVSAKPAPTPFQQLQAAQKPYKRSARDLGAERGAIGIAQDVAGLVDLLSPGKGTNRFSKVYDQQAKALDEKIRKSGLSNSQYKQGQVGINALFAIPGMFTGETEAAAGTALAKAAGKISPKTAQVVNKVPKVIQTLESKGPAGKIAASAIRGGVSPTAVKANLVGSTAYLGSQTGKGVKITPQDIATTYGLGAVGGAAIPATGRAVGLGAQAAGRGAIKGIQAAGRGLETYAQKVATGLETMPRPQKLGQEGFVGMSNLTPEERKMAAKQGVTPEMLQKGTLVDQQGKPVPQSKTQPAISPEPMAPVQQPKAPQVKAPVGSTGYTKKTYALVNQKLKEPGIVRRAMTTASGIISRYGEEGAAIANRINKANMRNKQYQQKIISAMPTVMRLSKKEIVQFADALDARSAGQTVNVGEKVNKAISEWNDVMPRILERARNANIQVGDLGPNYFPRIYKDKALNSAAAQMVAQGKAANLGEAQAIINQYKNNFLRRSGNLERTRFADIPNYEKTHDAILNYISNASERITKAEQFGANEEVLKQLISGVANQGVDIGDKSIFNKTLQTALGNIDMGTTGHKIASKAKAVQAFTSLQLAGISNVGQPLNTAVAAGLRNALRGAARYGAGTVSKKLNLNTKSAQALDRAISQGTVLENSINDVTAQMIGTQGKISSFLASPFFRQIENFNRTHSAIVSEIYGNQLAKQASKGSKRANRLLVEKLGVTGKVGKKLTPLQLSQAANGLDRIAQFHVNPANLPAWTNTPLGRVMFQFGQYPYKQTQFVVSFVLHEAIKGNPGPLLRLLTLAPVVGYGVSEGRRVVSGKPPQEGETLPQKIGRGFSAVGVGGLPAQYVSSLQAGEKYKTPTFENIARTFGGPTISTGVEISQAIDKYKQGNKQPLAKSVVRRIPVAGKLIAERAFPGQQAAIDKKVAEGKFNELTPREKMLATYKKPEEQNFYFMKEQQKKDAIKKNPALQDLYDKMKADEIHFRDDKVYPGLDKTSSATLNKFNKMTPDEKKKEFYGNKKADYEYALAQYNLKKSKNEYTKAKDLEERIKLGKLKTESNFDKSTREIYNLSKNELRLYLADDPNAEDTKNKLIALDNALKSAGDIKHKKFAKGIGTSTGGGGGTSTASGKKVKALRLKLSKVSKPKAVKLSGVKAKQVKLGKAQLPKGNRPKRIKIS